MHLQQINNNEKDKLINSDETKGHCNNCIAKTISILKNGTNIISKLQEILPKSTSVTTLTNANWALQYQLKPSSTNNADLGLFKSQSISGYLIWLGGPVHWVSKQQSITARSSTEAEIYVTDECTKQLLYLSHIVDSLNLTNHIMHHSEPYLIIHFTSPSSSISSKFL
jgi:hypothetical protein